MVANKKIGSDYSSNDSDLHITFYFKRTPIVHPLSIGTRVILA